jgi:hypothetical protein
MTLIQERSKINSITTSIEPPSMIVGRSSFAEGDGNRRVYLNGFEAGLEIVMEYWESNTDIEVAKSNIEHVKELMRATESKARFIKGKK